MAALLIQKAEFITEASVQRAFGAGVANEII